MSNTAINTLAYTGIVTLSQYIGTKKVKIAQVTNNGGSPLFDFLSDCLVGNIEQAQARKPTKIKLVNRYQDGNKVFYQSAAKDFIYIINTPVKLNNASQSRVKYSFLIPRELLMKVTNYEDLGLGLYTNSASASEEDVENFAAFCMLNLKKSDLTRSSLAVDWELIIANVAKQA